MFSVSSFISREWNSFQPSTTDVFILQCIFFSLLVYDLYCYAGGKGKTKSMEIELTPMTFLINAFYHGHKFLWDIVTGIEEGNKNSEKMWLIVNLFPGWIGENPGNEVD